MRLFSVKSSLRDKKIGDLGDWRLVLEIRVFSLGVKYRLSHVTHNLQLGRYPSAGNKQEISDSKTAQISI